MFNDVNVFHKNVCSNKSTSTCNIHEDFPISKLEVVLGIPGRVNIPCPMHCTRLYQIYQNSKNAGMYMAFYDNQKGRPTRFSKVNVFKILIRTELYARIHFDRKRFVFMKF